MRYSLMQDIMAGKLDEHLELELMVLEHGVAETMGSLQAHFRFYREPDNQVAYAPHVQVMFTSQALMRQLLAEPTAPCPQCKGEQEVARSARWFPPQEGTLVITLTCGHALPEPQLPRRNGSSAVQ